MNYIEFRNTLKPYPAISVHEIQKHFPRFDSRRLVEWQEKGYIKKIRNRYYTFSDQEADESFLFYTANRIYSPSYISLESALSRYGFIPEGVFQITSCTTLKTNVLETPVGSFAYGHIKPALYFGYRLVAWKDYRYAMANPEKAIIDYLYLHSEVQKVEDFEILRWNRTEIKGSFSIERLSRYETYINSPALSKRITTLKKFLDVIT